MKWTITAAGMAVVSITVTVVSMALWVHRLRWLKELLSHSRLFHEKPWVDSDTGFLIFSEMLADWSVMIFAFAFAIAIIPAGISPSHAYASLLVCLCLLFVRSIAVTIWCHLRAKNIHRDPKDDGSGVFGMAEIEWRSRRNKNAALASITWIPIALICLRMKT